MAKKNFFLFRQEFDQWLKQNGVGRIQSRNCYMMLDMYPGTKLLYYDIIGSFILNDEPVYAHSVLEEWGRQIAHDPNAKNKKSYWNKYRDFILYGIKNLPASTNTLSQQQVAQLAPIRRNFSKKQMAKLDGMDALIAAVGVKEFIRLAVESSFFFCEEAAENRFNEICNVIANEQGDPLFSKIGNALPVRKSSKDTANAMTGAHVTRNGKQWYADNGGNLICPIKEDKDGNSMVCQMINAIFGYNMNANTEDKPFKNYIISHIWGRAKDPRYFTNLWNIVLVPAWANHLLDKQNPPAGSLEAMLQNTFKEICIKHNKLSDTTKYSWGRSLMAQPLSSGNQLRGLYTIQVIKPKGYNPTVNSKKLQKAVIGKITTKGVKI